jgi:hypothetical protein
VFINCERDNRSDITAEMQIRTLELYPHGKPEFVVKVRDQKGPVGLDIYLRPKVFDETGICNASAAMVGAFFGLLGADYKGE